MGFWLKIVQGAEDPFLLQFRTLKKKLEEGMVFTEYEQIPKKKANGVFSTAALPENAERSRIREVVPYEENRVELIPTKENNTGYINASHIKVRRGAPREGLEEMAGLEVKVQGEKKNLGPAAPVPLGLSPDPEGMFPNIWAFLTQGEGHAVSAAGREPRDREDNIRSATSEGGLVQRI